MSHGAHSDKKKLPKKTKEDKIEKAGQIRELSLQYERIYVIQFSSAKTDRLSEIRREFRSSSLCMAKHNVIAHAFGQTGDDSPRPNLHLLNQYLVGNAGVFMTNETHDRVAGFLSSMTGPEFATTGAIATDTFTVEAGPLTQFTFNMDSYLRELGLPVHLENGTITNVRDYVVCTAGEPLSRNATKLLKHFDVKMGEFSAQPIAMWQDGQVLTPNR
jgi:mRNA turnover protein 4